MYREKKPSYVFKDVVYFDGQLDGLLDNGAIAVWCNLPEDFVCPLCGVGKDEFEAE